ncbi:MAG: LPXTG cell wall anchor domain-containing protein [Actinobacteria bacterium]|nr:LPXTG cell wall anchor domain-containing protein [Actinomycetota bacterium]
MSAPDHAENPTQSTGRRALARRGGAIGSAGLLAAGGAAALLAAIAAPAGAAATITVDSGGDGTADAAHCSDGTANNCTLRDAAAAADDGDTINFDASLSTITLTDGSVDTDAVIFAGPGSALLTITTTGGPGAYDVFRVGGTGDVVISGITVSRNRLKSMNAGKFRLDDVSVTGSTGAYGGALYAKNTGDLEVVNSSFTGNTATGAGGAIALYNTGTTTITSSTFTSNNSAFSGGAINSSATTSSVTITGCEFDGNSTSGQGGALRIGGITSLTFSGSTATNNTATSGGGAIFEQAATFTMLNSAVTGNSGDRGGAFYSDASSQVFVANSTLYGNSAVGEGGGIYFRNPALELDQVTIAANTAGLGGGIFGSAGSPPTATLSGTIVSANIATGNNGYGADIDATGTTLTVSSSHSIIGIANAAHVAVNDAGGTIRSSTPGLGTLADNGGTTKTLELLAGSVAINAGPNPVATFTGNGFDQRGTPLVRIYNSVADIGAFEVQPIPIPTTTTTSTTSTTTSTTTPNPSSSTSTTSTTSTTTPNPSTSTSTSTTTPASTSTSTSTTTPGSTSTTTPSGGSITPDFGPGDSIRSGNLAVTVNGTGGQPGAPFEVVVHSETTILGSGIVDPTGLFGGTYTLPASLGAGSHDVTATATDPTGNPITLNMWFSLDNNGTITAVNNDGPTPDPTADGTNPALPATGSDSTLLLTTGAGFALLGSTMAIAARRRLHNTN